MASNRFFICDWFGSTMAAMRRRLFAFAASILLAACGSTNQDGGVRYAIYGYNCCAEIMADTSWHAGQHLTLHWTAIAGQPTPDRTAHAMKLRIRLTGPFATVDALKHANGQGRPPAGVRSIDAITPSVTDRTGGTPASKLDLPGDLPAGYYNLETSVSSDCCSTGGATVVTIQ